MILAILQVWLLLVATTVSIESVECANAYYFSANIATPAIEPTDVTRTTHARTIAISTTENNLNVALPPPPPKSLRQLLPLQSCIKISRNTLRSQANTLRKPTCLFQQLRGGEKDTAVANTKTITALTVAAAAAAAALMMTLPRLMFLYKQLRHSVLRLNEYIGGNTQRCWMVLFLSILLDTTSTITMKQAQYDQSLTKLLLAYLGYFVRYVVGSSYTRKKRGIRCAQQLTAWGW
jgi:hypothetical protein